ncbi:serine/threonine-protein kinase sel-5-like [Harpegnathos saltator]|uniref:serine/threonine-protein kinase sel-5-like n=1 Tax=Harpegnathos saltator TaxID=610380 RepID=UPI000DBEE1A5|nr:serine/threonine-protein kinase sel-5-like [Harpegnathos saltator]
MARNGSLQYSGGYCCDVSHYRDAIPLGGTVVSLARPATPPPPPPSPSQPTRVAKKKRKKKKKKEEKKNTAEWRKVVSSNRNCVRV